MMTSTFPIKSFLLLAVAITGLLLSCTQESRQGKENANLLSQAAAVAETEPEQALKLLQAIDVRLLEEADYHYFVLLEVRALERTGKDVSSYESSVSQAEAYFSANQDAVRAAFACFCMAKVFEAQNNQLKTLHYYLQAEGWAKKVGYKIPHFLYSIIPYNAAIACYYNSDYQEAIHYANKALAYIENEEGGFKHKLYALELKGGCFRHTRCFDSALVCYHESLSIASKHNDDFSRNRIVYNLLNLESKDLDNVEVINRANSLLQNQPNLDSITTGAVYIMLAESYYSLNNMEQAVAYAENAISLLDNADEHVLKFLYNTLAKVGSKKKERHVSAKAQLSKQEGELLANQLAMKSYSRTLYKQEKSSRQKFMALLLFMLAATTAGTYLVQRRRRRFYRTLVSDDLKLALSRQSYLNQLKDLANNEKLADLADDLAHITTMSPTLDRCFGSLYHKLKKVYPALDDTELMVCWLKASRVADNADIMKLTNLSEEEYLRTYFTMQVKIREAGHSYALRSIVKTLFKDEEFYH